VSPNRYTKNLLQGGEHSGIVRSETWRDQSSKESAIKSNQEMRSDQGSDQWAIREEKSVSVGAESRGDRCWRPYFVSCSYSDLSVKVWSVAVICISVEYNLIINSRHPHYLLVTETQTHHNWCQKDVTERNRDPKHVRIYSLTLFA
jgi:hypothetical protein